LSAVAVPWSQAPMPEGAVIVITGEVIEPNVIGLRNASATETVSGVAIPYMASMVEPL